MCKVPVRLWIGVMVFFTTYIHYTVTVNISMSIISMVKGKAKKVPECLEHTHGVSIEDVNVTQHVLPDFGPRYDWDEHHQGLILGGYFWGYTILSFPAGTIAEKWGPYKVILGASVVSCFVNGLCVPAIQLHYLVLVLCRFILGTCGGLSYPSLQVLIARWAPPNERGKFVACMMGNTIATCVTWPVVAYVISHWGWDWSFYVISIQQAVYCVVFFVVAADSPETHKYISEEEVAYIKESQGESVSAASRMPPFKAIFSSIPFWMLNILHFGNLWGLFVQLQSVPKFMAEVIGFKLKQAGVIGALPHLTRFIFGTTFGIVGDHLKTREIMTSRTIRKSFILSSHIVPGILMVCICFVGCNWVPVIILLTLSMGLNGAVVLTSLQNPQDLAPNFAGTTFGIISSIGGSTGFLVPSIAAFFIHEHNGMKEWSNTFILGGVMYITTGFIFILFGSVDEQSWNRL